ncbi:hypothetical protein CFP56_039295 [Quercus suber]|uniref:Uncharacterized protein n=1 Tax=Quercus suber TaxID=58331 RepID=A0AAW0J0A9_QUESU
MSRGKERAIQAAKKFKPNNLSFMGISQPHNMVYVPIEFSTKYIIGKQFVTLQCLCEVIEQHMQHSEHQCSNGGQLIPKIIMNQFRDALPPRKWCIEKGCTRATMLVGPSLGNSAERTLRTHNPCHRQYTSNSPLFSYKVDHGGSTTVNSIAVYEYHWSLTRAMHGAIEQHDED